MQDIKDMSYEMVNLQEGSRCWISGVGLVSTSITWLNLWGRKGRF